MKNELIQMIPPDWRKLLQNTLSSQEFSLLAAFLEEEYRKYTIFPEKKDIFASLRFTPPEKVKVLLLGQDPYHGEGQAHGLAFSVAPGVAHPASLRNIFKEYAEDLALPLPENGSLIPWAKQGVLLLNSVLTVRAHEPNSHKGKGWEFFTDSVIRSVNSFPRGVIFLLWGNSAQKKLSLIDTEKHTVLLSAHPSPLSAYRGFLGSRPFSRTNEALFKKNIPGINWDLGAGKKVDMG